MLASLLGIVMRPVSSKDPAENQPPPTDIKIYYIDDIPQDAIIEAARIAICGVDGERLPVAPQMLSVPQLTLNTWKIGTVIIELHCNNMSPKSALPEDDSCATLYIGRARARGYRETEKGIYADLQLTISDINKDYTGCLAQISNNIRMLNTMISLKRGTARLVS